MRSHESMPANPWPHDMTLTVEDRPNQLLELLWLREAFGLHPAGDDLPPLLTQTPYPAVTAIDDQTREEWELTWTRMWAESVTHVGREFDPSLFDELQRLPAGSAERETVVQQMFGPSWGDEHGRDAFEDPSWLTWDRTGMAEFFASRPEVLENSPERLALDALIPAWRAGLTKIVTVPCRGEYTRRVGANALIVTDGTRADTERFRAALRTFI